MIKLWKIDIIKCFMRNLQDIYNFGKGGGMERIKIKHFHHLDIYFTNFMKFLDKIIKKTDINRSIEMTKLSNDICDYINQIIPGIYSLKDTYPSYKKLHCKVDSIILTLIDFKGEVRKKTKSQSIKYPPSLII